ncbi:glycosyl transferase, partial [Baffinella frigidus]
QATAHSLRDRMVERANDTEQLFDDMGARRVYYLSLEFLMGRTLCNAVSSLGLEGRYAEALQELGFRLEDLYEEEKDAALGNGGLGRLAACFMDSLATLNYPAWGYGLRYSYGLFEQRIFNGEQVELPDSWLTEGNPWEVERLDVQYTIRFFGKVVHDETGAKQASWEGGDLVQAVAYDNLIPGHGTRNTLNLRLWASKPTRQLDMALFNAGDYQGALEARQKSENITSVLYPNDESYSAGKELRLKQQYFLVAATLRDILERFRRTQKPLGEMSTQLCIQLNDTHPALGIPELVRLLVDEEHLPWEEAWEVTTAIYTYTNHTVLPEAMEEWDVEMFEVMLPRHMEIIYQINHRFLQEVTKYRLLTWREKKKIRMAHLALVGCNKVNGVAEIHTEILKTETFKLFYRLWPHKFCNVTNGVTPRRWLQQANPALAALLSSVLEGDAWRSDFSLVSKVRAHARDPLVQARWQKVKQANKQRLADLIERECNVTLDPHMLFDAQVKRIHEYKRQLLNVFGIIHRHSELRRMKREAPGLLGAVVPRAFIFAGKAAPGYKAAKEIIKLILAVAQAINEDPETNHFLRVVFIPNYNVKLAEIVIPGSDVSQHLSTSGTEARPLTNHKYFKMINYSYKLIYTLLIISINYESCYQL